MKNKIQWFNNFFVETPVNKILYRLKYRKTKTGFSDKYKNKIINQIEFAKSLCSPKGCYRRVNILEIKQKQIFCENNILIESQSLSELLQNSNEIVFIAVTVGNEIVEITDKLINENKTSEAVVYDAVASEVADESMNFINKNLKQNVFKEYSKLTDKRFSPGYGDLKLEIQKQIFKVLELEKLGLKLTENYLIIPQKSVTAICGIEN